jgi:hypothetical protein
VLCGMRQDADGVEDVEKVQEVNEKKNFLATL